MCGDPALNKAILNAAHKIKDRFRLYDIVESDFATTVTAKCKPGVKDSSRPFLRSCAIRPRRFLHVQVWLLVGIILKSPLYRSRAFDFLAFC